LKTPVQKKVKPTLNPVLKPFWKTKADLKVLKGGRASSKTWDAAGFAVFLASNYSVKFLCVRQFQNRISESVYAVLKIQIERFGLSDEFDIQKSVIRHKTTGSEFHFYGIHRNIAEIKGFEGADICWIEEGEGLTSEQWAHIEPTLRKEGAECWLLYNPRLETDFVETSDLFKHDPENGVIVRHINYDENPFLSQTMLRKIAKLKRLDREAYEHIYLGIPKSNDDEAVIKRSWIMAAIDAHIKLDIEILGSKEIGFDVADSGKDLNSQIYKHGIVALWGEHWKGAEDELLKSCKRVYRKAVEFGAEINYDSIGVGATAGSKFKELNEESNNKSEIEFTKFIAGAKVVNPDGYYIDAGKQRITNAEFFCNLKSQAWWLVADRFRNTYNAVVNGEKFDVEDLISISSNMPGLQNLVLELSTPRKDFAKDGRVKVEDKKDLAARDIISPNDADAFIMAYAPKKRKRRSFFNV
jgi:phage terminase large subunit